MKTPDRVSLLVLSGCSGCSGGFLGDRLLDLDVFDIDLDVSILKKSYISGGEFWVDRLLI